jgi:hypothetical protein
MGTEAIVARQSLNYSQLPVVFCNIPKERENKTL